MRRSIHRAMLAAAVCGALATAATSARAQGFVAYDFQPRLYVGLGLGFNYLFNDSLYFAEDGTLANPDADHVTRATQWGLGWDISVGLRFHEWAAAEIAWDGIWHEQPGGAGYAMIDGFRLTGRLYFPTGFNLLPFLRLGVGYYFYGDEFEVDRQGVGFEGGVGATYQFLNNILEFDIELLYRAWYFEGMDVGGEDDDLHCESGRGYCPFGDQYMHGIYLQLGFRWNSWLFAW